MYKKKQFGYFLTFSFFLCHLEEEQFWDFLKGLSLTFSVWGWGDGSEKNTLYLIFKIFMSILEEKFGHAHLMVLFFLDGLKLAGQKSILMFMCPIWNREAKRSSNKVDVYYVPYRKEFLRSKGTPGRLQLVKRRASFLNEDQSFNREGIKQDHQWWRYHRRLFDYQSPYF